VNLSHHGHSHTGVAIVCEILHFDRVSYPLKTDLIPMLSTERRVCPPS
jgi:hypothetical protein